VSLSVIGCNLRQNANEGCNSCASLAGPELVLSFIVSFIASFTVVVIPHYLLFPPGGIVIPRVCLCVCSFVMIFVISRKQVFSICAKSHY